MKDIYIIQGKHYHPSGKILEGDDDIAKMQEVSRRIAKELILREGIERFFRDGQSAESMDYVNQFLLGEKRLKKKSSDPHVDNNLKWIRMSQECRDQGVDLLWAPTESDTLTKYNPLAYGIERYVDTALSLGHFALRCLQGVHGYHSCLWSS